MSEMESERLQYERKLKSTKVSEADGKYQCKLYVLLTLLCTQTCTITGPLSGAGLTVCLHMFFHCDSSLYFCEALGVSNHLPSLLVVYSVLSLFFSLSLSLSLSISPFLLG